MIYHDIIIWLAKSHYRVVSLHCVPIGWFVYIYNLYFFIRLIMLMYCHGMIYFDMFICIYIYDDIVIYVYIYICTHHIYIYI